MTSEARRAAGLYVDDSWRTAGSSDRFSDAEAANELRMLDECAAPPQAPPLTLPLTLLSPSLSCRLQKDRSRAITPPDKGPREANVGALDRARATAAQGHSISKEISRI